MNLVFLLFCWKKKLLLLSLDEEANFLLKFFLHLLIPLMSFTLLNDSFLCQDLRNKSTLFFFVMEINALSLMRIIPGFEEVLPLLQRSSRIELLLPRVVLFLHSFTHRSWSWLSIEHENSISHVVYWLLFLIGIHVCVFYPLLLTHIMLSLVSVHCLYSKYIPVWIIFLGRQELVLVIQEDHLL